jgi:hypothetical protein
MAAPCISTLAARKIPVPARTRGQFAVRPELQYVSRDIKYINNLLEQHQNLKTTLNKRDWKLLQVIHEVFGQQQANVYRR